MAFSATRWGICLVVLLCTLPSVFGLYFYLEGAEQKCFIEELPKETMVSVHYTAEEWNEDSKRFAINKEVIIEVVVDELPDGNRIFHQKLSPKGQFKFTSAESGEHAICFFSSISGWFSSTKVRFNLDMAVTDILEEMSGDTGEAISDLERSVRELNHKVGDIRREQSYLRDHESEFRDKSEAANSHAVTWTLFQLIVLGITCAWQMRHLRGFFESRKMI
ncbi:emp24p/erv25p- protein [Modicella reniformis]|uniref:Emp24p/erv25p- protein n=1 Tax=Modicella reniformis TaxID=1440133 RepID=A0A9P6IYB7_9FUNG|nr:emp24p/erv25p- protein [Modicella reniformis]